jgi:hypothetical protein
MTPADLRACAAFLDRLIRVTGPALGEIALLSPNHAQYRLVRRAYPGARIQILTIDDWDVREPGAHGFDLIVANNVLHYVSEAGTAIANLMRSSSYVWIQDLIDRERGELGFAPDGDCMRYSFTPHFKSSFEGAFDLSAFAGHAADHQEYAAELGRGERPARHFTVILKSGPARARLPSRPYRYGQQALRRARIGAGHLWHSLGRPSVRAIVSAPGRLRSDPSRPQPSGGGDA